MPIGRFQSNTRNSTVLGVSKDSWGKRSFIVTPGFLQIAFTSISEETTLVPQESHPSVLTWTSRRESLGFTMTWESGSRSSS